MKKLTNIIYGLVGRRVALREIRPEAIDQWLLHREVGLEAPDPLVLRRALPRTADLILQRLVLLTKHLGVLVGHCCNFPLPEGRQRKTAKIRRPPLCVNAVYAQLLCCSAQLRSCSAPQL